MEIQPTISTAESPEQESLKFHGEHLFDTQLFGKVVAIKGETLDDSHIANIKTEELEDRSIYTIDVYSLNGPDTRWYFDSLTSELRFEYTQIEDTGTVELDRIAAIQNDVLEICQKTNIGPLIDEEQSFGIEDLTPPREKSAYDLAA